MCGMNNVKLVLQLLGVKDKLENYLELSGCSQFFVGYVMILSVLNTIYSSMKRPRDWWMLSLEGCGRKRSWPTLK